MFFLAVFPVLPIGTGDVPLVLVGLVYGLVVSELLLDPSNEGCP